MLPDHADSVLRRNAVRYAVARADDLALADLARHAAVPEIFYAGVADLHLPRVGYRR